MPTPIQGFLPLALTVRQLREMLEGLPDDMPVLAAQPSHDYWRTTVCVRVQNAELLTVEWSPYHDLPKFTGDTEGSPNCVLINATT